MRLRRDAHTEVNVGLRMLRLTAGADGPDDLALGDSRADPHARRPEVDERDREALGGPDRHRHA